jgi:uncharacterized repeat protein (TIGR03803 family)
LVAAGGMLYGTTYSGGIDTNGTIFAINTNGTGFSNYHSFTQVGYPYPTNSDGAYPEAGMVLSGSTLYGTTMSGGTNGFGYGTIFSINTNGMDFKPVLDFNYTQGYGPLSDLIVANNVLYGTTTGGGTYLAGTIFSVNTNGTDLTDLYSFPLANYSGTAYTNSTGTDPWAGVVFSGNGLFGVTPVGGTGGVGTVYGLILGSSAPVPIPLNTQLTNGTLTLTWSDATFSLQSTTDLGLAFTNVPGAVSPYSVSTNSPEQFFRLQAN